MTLDRPDTGGTRAPIPDENPIARTMRASAFEPLLLDRPSAGRRRQAETGVTVAPPRAMKPTRCIVLSAAGHADRQQS